MEYNRPDVLNIQEDLLACQTFCRATLIHQVEISIPIGRKVFLDPAAKFSINALVLITYSFYSNNLHVDSYRGLKLTCFTDVLHPSM